MKRAGKKSLKFRNKSLGSVFSEAFKDGYARGRMESALENCYQMRDAYTKEELHVAVWEVCGLPKTDYDALVDWMALRNKGAVNGRATVGGIFAYNKEGVTSSAYSIGKVVGDTLVGLVIGHNYNSTMADYYYLKQGKQEPFGLNDGGGVATPKTESEMKSEEFAELLSEYFTYDSGLNDGWPTLKWEKE